MPLANTAGSLQNEHQGCLAVCVFRLLRQFMYLDPSWLIYKLKLQLCKIRNGAGSCRA